MNRKQPEMKSDVFLYGHEKSLKITNGWICLNHSKPLWKSPVVWGSGLHGLIICKNHKGKGWCQAGNC